MKESDSKRKNNARIEIRIKMYSLNLVSRTNIVYVYCRANFSSCTSDNTPTIHTFWVLCALHLPAHFICAKLTRILMGKHASTLLNLHALKIH